jgi:hypothetical protein
VALMVAAFGPSFFPRASSGSRDSGCRDRPASPKGSDARPRSASIAAGSFSCHLPTEDRQLLLQLAAWFRRPPPRVLDRSR